MFDVIREPLVIHKVGDATSRREIVMELMRAVGLDPRFLNRYPHSFSGGQAQRVAVARAFYRHLRKAASVIALDEPSAALDAETEARLWASVRELADAGATVLLVSHRESARAIADQIVTVTVSEVMA